MRTYVVVFCVLLLTSIAFAQFEGQIDMKMTRGSGEEKRETQLSMFIKQGMLAFSVAGNEAEDPVAGQDGDHVADLGLAHATDELHQGPRAEAAAGVERHGDGRDGGLGHRSVPSGFVAAVHAAPPERIR